VTDPLNGALRDLAVAAFPGLYEPLPASLPRSAYHGLSMFPRIDSIFTHEAVHTFNAAAQMDDDLRAVYEHGDSGLYVSASSGSGWHIQPSLFAASIIGSAARRIMFTGRDTGDLELLLTTVEQTTAETRRLLQGQPVEASAVTGFNGISVAGSADVATPWGTLRTASSAITESRAWWAEPFGDPVATAVVETLITVHYSQGEPSDVLERLQLESRESELLRHVALLLPLTLMLALPREDHFVVCEALWQTTLLPAQPGIGLSGRRPGTGSRVRKVDSIQPVERDAVATWAHRVEDHYDPSIFIAVRRALSAVRERVDPEDALIDAVIACESLFGHGAESEVTFRVTSAISLLLESEADRRPWFRSQLRKVYDSRSKVVHGGSVTPETLQEHKEIAISVAIRCLRALLEVHPHLIGDATRGVRLILRDDEPRA